MSKSYAVINGQTFDYDSLTLPASGRKFRDAWDTPVDGVVTIDLDKAKTIKAEQVLAELRQRWEKAGGPFGPAVPAKWKAAPNAPAIQNANTPEELEAITVDELIV
jgi:hypothetical protein